MDKWILKRLFEDGDQATPRFAYQSTVNWMEALAIICRSKLFSSEKLKTFYEKVPRRPSVNRKADTLVFENILMALHNIAALNAMGKKKTDHNCPLLKITRSDRSVLQSTNLSGKSVK